MNVLGIKKTYIFGSVLDGKNIEDRQAYTNGFSMMVNRFLFLYEVSGAKATTKLESQRIQASGTSLHLHLQ